MADTLKPYTTEYDFSLGGDFDSLLGKGIIEAVQAQETNGNLAVINQDDSILLKGKEHIIARVIKRTIDLTTLKDVKNHKLPVLYRLIGNQPSTTRENTLTIRGDQENFEDPTTDFISVDINTINDIDESDTGYLFELMDENPNIIIKVQNVNYKIICIANWTKYVFEVDAIKL